MIPFGQVIKGERERKGISLDQASRDMKILVKYLSAIEEERFEDLPPEPYATAMVRAYCSYLGLPVEDMMRAYKEKRSSESGGVRIELLKPPSERKGWKRVALISSQVALLFAIFLLYQMLVSHRPGEKAKKEVAKLPEKVQEASILPSGTGGEIVEVRAVERTWVLVLVDGEKAFEGILKGGDSMSWKGKRVEMKVGNAGGLKVYHNGKELPPLGPKGKVVRISFPGEG
jgi:cytoskeletal protein RodZ